MRAIATLVSVGSVAPVCVAELAIVVDFALVDEVVGVVRPAVLATLDAVRGRSTVARLLSRCNISLHSVWIFGCLRLRLVGCLRLRIVGCLRLRIFGCLRLRLWLRLWLNRIV